MSQAALYIGGVLFMFCGLAIIADEFFVPALDLIATTWGTGIVLIVIVAVFSKWPLYWTYLFVYHLLELSDDVSGATLMAAGGSAPELFTSLVATFLRSDIGFGAIVGSAVFNVLFVIGVCAVVSILCKLN
jgi:Ca2+/Na+ antiporter